MSTFEISLKTQQWKLFAKICSLFILPLLLITTFKPELGFNLLMNLFIVVLLCVQIYDLAVYFMYGKCTFIAEIDGNTIQFYNLNEAGESYNISTIWDMSDYDSFYIIKTTDNYYFTRYRIEFQLPYTKGRINAYSFPSLWEPTQSDIEGLSSFIGTLGRTNDRDKNFWAMFQK